MSILDELERFSPVVGVVIAAFSLGILRWSCSAELSTQGPFIYAIWGILIWIYAPRIESFWFFIGSALVLRLGCVGTELVWSDDAYRYLWEGKVVLSGGNPYTIPPASFTIQDGIREHVNHPTIPTVYPPLAQYWFVLQTSLWYHPSMVQISSALVDVGTASAIWVWLSRKGVSLRNAWVYALHPLPIIECAWSGHVESFALCCLAWGLVLYERWGRWVWFAGGWVKLFPFVFLLFTSTWRVRTIALMLLFSGVLIFPFWDSMALEGLRTYAVHWSYNALIFGVLSLFNPTFARPICLLLAGVASAYVWGRWYQLQLSIEKAILWLGIIFVLCSPTVHPWYALWVMVPTLMVSGKRTQMVCGLWCSLIPLTYVSILTLNPLTGEWSPPLWPTLVSYLVPLVLWLRLRFRKVPA